MFVDKQMVLVQNFIRSELQVNFDHFLIKYLFLFQCHSHNGTATLSRTCVLGHRIQQTILIGHVDKVPQAL